MRNDGMVLVPDSYGPIDSARTNIFEWLPENVAPNETISITTKLVDSIRTLLDATSPQKANLEMLLIDALREADLILSQHIVFMNHPHYIDKVLSVENALGHRIHEKPIEDDSK